MFLIKVFVETSVLVSASIFNIAAELGIKLEHEFYNISISLFHLLKVYAAKERMGITTITVEEEAFGVLANAIMDTMEETAKEIEPEKREELFKLHSAFYNACTDNLAKNKAILLREPIDEDERDKKYPEIDKMYQQLKFKGENIDFSSIAKVMAFTGASRRYRKLAEQIYREQIKMPLKPLTRLPYKPPSRRDKLILTEAICLMNRYKKEHEKLIFFLASTDLHFSPLYWCDPSGIEHKEEVLSGEIKARFGIKCDWPDKIEAEIKEYLEI